MLEVSLRATNVQPLVRNMLFGNASVTHVRNRRRHASRPFNKAIHEKTYNNTPTVICGTNADRMIQAGLVSQQVCYHVVLDADVPPRTHEDGLGTGIWPEEWNPEDMLCKMNDGQNMLKGNPMLLLTPLGRTGLPIEVPQSVYMVAVVGIKIIVTTAKAICYFANNGQILTTSAIPTGGQGWSSSL